MLKNTGYMNDDELYSWGTPLNGCTTNGLGSSAATIGQSTNLQAQIYDLISKNYSLEYKNGELLNKINDLESEIITLMVKVENLEEIIVKICEEYILTDTD